MYLPIECTNGGTNRASFSCDSGFDWYSMNVCSILLKVVGVKVGVVLVGTPELSPSSVRNWKRKKQLLHLIYTSKGSWSKNLLEIPQNEKYFFVDFDQQSLTRLGQLWGCNDLRIHAN